MWYFRFEIVCSTFATHLVHFTIYPAFLHNCFHFHYFHTFTTVNQCGLKVRVSRLGDSSVPSFLLLRILPDVHVLAAISWPQIPVGNILVAIFFTFNARERLYFISVSSCVSITYIIIRYQVKYEQFAQHLYRSFIHIEHLHIPFTIFTFILHYYIITVVVLCGV